jgi:hypothetical protein
MVMSVGQNVRTTYIVSIEGDDKLSKGMGAVDFQPRRFANGRSVFKFNFNCPLKTFWGFKLVCHRYIILVYSISYAKLTFSSYSILKLFQTEYNTC